MKNKKTIIITIVVLALIILIIPLVRKAYSGGGNVNTTKEIKINGFQYGKGFAYVQDAECILKDVKISSYNASNNINGKNVSIQEAQIECNVIIKPANGQEISFFFKGNGPSYEVVSKKLPFHPTLEKPIPDLKSIFMGFCYDRNKKPIPGYSFYLSPDLSSASFVMGAGSRSFFYSQIADKHWIIVCPMVNNNPNVKAFFFSNDVKADSFKESAIKGSLFDELKKMNGGKMPSMEDIYNFVIKEIGEQ